MFAASNVRIELADKLRAIGAGGIGLMHQLAREIHETGVKLMHYAFGMNGASRAQV
jgi:hypothetical protein